MSEGVNAAEPGRFPEIPKAEPLSLEEIQKVAVKDLGLRGATPTKLEEQKQQGVEGDYITLFDLSGFVVLKRDSKLAKKRERLGVSPEDLINMAIRQGKFEDLEGVNELPDKFDTALRKFLQFERGPGIYTRDMKVEDYLRRRVPGDTPAFQVIKDSNSQTSYDKEKYYTFGKAGNQKITPDRILASISWDEEGSRLIRARYHSFSQLPINSVFGRYSLTLDRAIDNDVQEILRGKILTAIRSAIAE